MIDRTSVTLGEGEGVFVEKDKDTSGIDKLFWHSGLGLQLQYMKYKVKGV